MSWGTCYSGSNNIHMGFPALMSDGRLYANWESSCESNNALKAKEGIKNNYDYRQYLIKNGMRQGSSVGKVLKAIEEEWLKNNFQISKKRVKEIIHIHSN